ncbi:hypothetical protein [Winogradskyella damuponensis]|uniref:Tubulin/FtsZ GTPase domain-containing protein n=1 Tax=Winogradskyella damuponensis TaxID=943939 RepID=A0ABP8CSI9_9FLAO
MSKLYIFAIGGTGSRVLKSLTYLLASGVKCNSEKIIPIIIDPDAANGDVSLTTNTLRSYQKIRKSLSFDTNTSNQFFKTEIESQTPNFRIKILNSDKKFKDYIGLASMDRTNRALTSMLFSEKNLEATMDVGFKGNPNMGSVVLNQFQHSDDFKTFASSFSQNDRIFIISSIFGGTGASGFPLLLKNLRQASSELDNHQLLKKSNIGAISVLPYFGVRKDENSEIEKSTFISKTKAALHYYEHGVNNDVNRMYYIGDDINRDYENNEGSTSQKNDAHFIELASAMAILDFANESVTDQNEVREFGINKNSKNISFPDLDGNTKNILFKPLSQYYLFNLYLENKFSKTFDQRFSAELGLNSNFLNTEFYQELKRFNKGFWTWLVQMSSNERGFSPFTLELTNSEIFNAINGIPLKRSNWKGVKNYERFIEFLNKSLKYDERGKTIEDRFIDIFYNTTNLLIQEK